MGPNLHQHISIFFSPKLRLFPYFRTTVLILLYFSSNITHVSTGPFTPLLARNNAVPWGCVDYKTENFGGKCA